MISIIVGGQFGSEGKGKVAHYFAKKRKAKIAVRVGGTNSGHTVVDENGKEYIFRMLPTAAIVDQTECILPSGSYIDIDILFKEIELVGMKKERLKIDPNAVIITSQQVEQERKSGLKEKIGSTASGTGAAVMARISRNSDIILAKDEPRLKEYVVPSTKAYLREEIKAGNHIIVEGTQGYGLSVFHSDFYPYVTSRDTTAAGFLSELGLSPFDVEDIVLVIRAFPIRVSGDSGPLKREIDWNTVTAESKSKNAIIERTTVTNNIRRVARFDADVVNNAIIANNPNIIVLNHIDYVDAQCFETELLTKPLEDYICNVEASINRKVDFIGTGKRTLFTRHRNEGKI